MSVLKVQDVDQQMGNVFARLGGLDLNVIKVRLVSNVRTEFVLIEVTIICVLHAVLRDSRLCFISLFKF